MGPDQVPLTEAQLKAMAAYMADYLGLAPDPGLPQLYTQKETARALSVSERTIDTLVAMNELCPIRVTPSRRGRRFDGDSIKAFLRSRTGRRGVAQ